MKCTKHDFEWEISDPMGCPVCYGINLERERLLDHLERVQTWYPDKYNAWWEGYETAELRIIKLEIEKIIVDKIRNLDKSESRTEVIFTFIKRVNKCFR